MRLTVQLKLQPTVAQADALKRTLTTANAACDRISRVAWASSTFRQFALHKLVYRDVRAAFGLSAQLTVRCIAKVADAYKRDRKTPRTFQPLGALGYDARILSFNLQGASVSIWTVEGRHTIPFVCGERQRTLLIRQSGETDLVYRQGGWYLFATCEVPAAAPIAATGTLGVDLGVANIATDSDGTIHSGKALTAIRYRHRHLRTKLQKKGTLGSRRRLRKLSGQERRFATYTNHVIAKRLVSAAERTRRQIALEDLKHIQTRVRARKSQRPILKGWAFAQLQAFIVYKAVLAGVPVCFVDPRNTSRRCPACGHIDKANRKTQAHFLCTSCGYTGHADVIAAINIGGRAAVNRPDCSDAPGG